MIVYYNYAYVIMTVNTCVCVLVLYLINRWLLLHLLLVLVLDLVSAMAAVMLLLLLGAKTAQHGVNILRQKLTGSPRYQHNVQVNCHVQLGTLELNLLNNPEPLCQIICDN